MKTLTRRALTFLLLASVLTAFTLVAPTPARAGSITITNVTATSTAARIVVGSQNNSSVQIENLGSATAYIGTTSGVLSTTGQAIPTSTVTMLYNVSNSIYAITASSTADLRITVNTGGGTVSSARLLTTGISNGAAANTIGMSDGTNIVSSTVLISVVSTAITANSTATALAAGSVGLTSNSTGRGQIFFSDGSLWQLPTTLSEDAVMSTASTIATTSTTDQYVIAPCTGILNGADFTSVSALAASDTNLITWTLVNLGQSAGGSTAMLAVVAGNSTATTGGTALTAFARRQMTLHGTAGNLVVAKGDVIRIRATVTGTLVGSVTGATMILKFTRTV